MRKLAISVLVFICLFGLSGLFVFGQKKQTKKFTKPTKTIKSVVSQPVETLEQQIGRVARSHNLDVRLFQALIYTESVFRIRAVSYKGAACYTQLMPATARRFGLRVDSLVDERFQAEKCLNAGAYYLAWLLRYFRGDVRLALAGYNAGEGAVMKYGWRVPPYKETVQYVEKICALYYGQSGHAITLAYNQPLANNWVNELYSRNRGRLKNTASVQSAFFNKSPMTGSHLPLQTVPETKANDSKKPIVTRVIIEEKNSRIRTQSLSFGNK